MKLSFFLIILLLVTSCKNSSSFESIPCEDSGQSYMVFKPCRQMTFNAKLWDAEYNLISESKIWMMATGRPWEVQPDKQKEIVIQYEFDPKYVDKINQENINKSLELSWVYDTNTGIIENSYSIWMHPFRQNQYTFTEVAPFPEVRLPLEIDKTWSVKLNIEGWGDWTNSTLNNYYEVVSYESVELSYGKLEAWHISSYTEAPFGNSTHNFWFHPELGFVKMVIHNYAGQTLEIELIDMIDN